ncbi:tigger transposable element-derived protein 4-like [Corticium candelabrum]|uniref:tigger transposable element-derived protein 4-like n=1 Tax=Corticium candelabrum TaxID=121492 RepID=UPI002E271921|nr:tigger transposable element-derived protein 4-like [Corticium candelabrum]
MRRSRVLSMASRKRKRLSFSEKYAILAELDSGVSRNALEKKYDVPHGTLAGIIKDRRRIEEAVASGTSLGAKSSKLSRYSQIDAALLEWFRRIRTNCPETPITCLEILTKATAIGKELKRREVAAYKSFDENCLDLNWVDRWKKRNAIASKKMHAESQSADKNAAADWVQNQLQLIRQEFSDDNFFNADETALFWKLMPDRTLAFKGEKCRGGKHSKERLTILVDASATGEKLSLFAIGKSKKPHCFRGVANIPVAYDANRTAWMTKQLFEPWLRKLNAKMLGQKRKIALILDNFSGHPQVALSNVKVFFLPPNTTSIVQPMDAGIIKNLKFHYRRLLMKKPLLCYETETPFAINVLHALEWLKIAWKSVDAQEWKSRVFRIPFRFGATQRMPGLTQGIDWTEFVDVDQCVAVGPSSKRDSVNDILDTVFPETREPLDESTTSDEEDVEEIDTSPPPSFKEAMTSIGSALDYLRTIQGSEAECLKLANIREYMVTEIWVVEELCQQQNLTLLST